MSKSATVRTKEWRAIRQLVDECRELGDAPLLWRRHLYEQSALLAGADLALGGEFYVFLDGRSSAIGTVEWGWENGLNRRGWLEGMAEYKNNPDISPLIVAYNKLLLDNDGVCISRSDVMSDMEWYNSVYYTDIHAVIGVDHTLQCYHSIPNSGEQFTSITLGRTRKRQDFSAREKAVIRELQASIASLVGGPLARYEERSPAGLRRREREVLRCLLAGNSDKQIARQLNLSKYTINQYTKTIYKYFGVASRPELLARWIRRGWGARCGWAASQNDEP